MLSKTKKDVKFTLHFDENGNITDVQNPHGESCPKKNLRDAPIQNVIGTISIVFTKDDDPCIIQGGIKWCW